MSWGTSTTGVAKIKQKSALQIISGVVLAVGGFTSSMSELWKFFIYEGSWLRFMFLVCAAIVGIVLLIRGIRYNSLIKKFYEYSRYLEMDPNKYVSILAASVRESTSATTENLTRMIALDFFPNMHLDATKTKLVYHGIDVSGGISAGAAGGFAEVKCSGCGAVNQIPKGGSGVCEYCGSTLTAEINK